MKVTNLLLAVMVMCIQTFYGMNHEQEDAMATRLRREAIELARARAELFALDKQRLSRLVAADKKTAAGRDALTTTETSTHLKGNDEDGLSDQKIAFIQDWLTEIDKKS